MNDVSDSKNNINDTKGNKPERRISISNVLEEASSVIMNAEDSISFQNIIGMPTSSRLFHFYIYIWELIKNSETEVMCQNSCCILYLYTPHVFRAK